MLRIFLRGFLALMPIVLTIYFIYWFTISLEGVVDNILFKNSDIPKNLPGLGVLSALSIIFILGLLMGIVPFSKLFGVIQLPLKNIPLVKSIYTAFEDLIFFFSKASEKGEGKVVRIKVPGSSYELIGLLTRKELSNIKNLGVTTDKVAVFIPMSYALGGYTIFVPIESVTLIEMSVETAMKSAITAWMQKE